MDTQKTVSQSAAGIWTEVCAEIQRVFSDVSFNLWFSELRLVLLRDDAAYMAIPSDFKQDILYRHYGSNLRDCFETVLRRPLREIVIVSTEHLPAKAVTEDSIEQYALRQKNAQQVQPDEDEGLASDLYKDAPPLGMPETGKKPAPKEPVQKIDPAQIEMPLKDAEVSEIVKTSADDPGVAVIEEPQVEPVSAAKPDDGEEKQKISAEVFFKSNTEYTFENFIVGSSNKFAHAACMAVARYPSQTYNPLFIYGAPGLGKTHLMYAITQEIAARWPAYKITYVKGEEFTNQLVEMLAHEHLKSAFREKFRGADVLLIDDIQFIAGKPATQEEFFHTFNSLYEANKQIILTSDRPPKDIAQLEERLRSRFECGLIADIQPPDMELRIAILKRKANMMNITVPNDVLMFLAERISTNIRQLEGVIKKLNAYSYLNNSKITLELAKSCINDILSGTEPVNIRIDRIIEVVAKKYGIPASDIKSRRRTKEISQARHVVIYLIRHTTELSLPSIGKVFGRDHTTMISSIESVEREMEKNSVFNMDIQEMLRDIGSPQMQGSFQQI